MLQGAGCRLHGKEAKIGVIVSTAWISPIWGPGGREGKVAGKNVVVKLKIGYRKGNEKTGDLFFTVIV
jgi:hypothetical protein